MVRTIFAVVALGIAGGVFYFVTKPTYDKVQINEAQIAQYDGELNQVAEMQKLAEDLNTQFTGLNQGDVDRLQKLLPDHVDNIALILDLDKMASHWGMPLENVDVSTPAAGTAQNPNITAESSARKYDSLTLKFSTKGTYDSFTKLMTDLESSLRVVDLTSLTLNPSSDTLGGVPVYQYDVEIRTYWLK
jgi:Tfp pilus assembly protein PilO